MLGLGEQASTISEGVMLESANDRVIGVDTPGQQVPQRVQYGMTCLLIRDVVGSVPCSDE
jgi:hypothetical protein